MFYKHMLFLPNLFNSFPNDCSHFYLKIDTIYILKTNQLLNKSKSLPQNQLEKSQRRKYFLKNYLVEEKYQEQQNLTHTQKKKKRKVEKRCRQKLQEERKFNYKNFKQFLQKYDSINSLYKKFIPYIVIPYFYIRPQIRS